MNVDTAQLPDDVDALKNIIATFSDREQDYESRIKNLEEQINVLQHRLFGGKSEKLSREAGSGQLSLFNEAEQTEAAVVEEGISVPAHQRRRGKRTLLPQYVDKMKAGRPA